MLICWVKLHVTNFHAELIVWGIQKLLSAVLNSLGNRTLASNFVEIVKENSWIKEEFVSSHVTLEEECLAGWSFLFSYYSAKVEEKVTENPASLFIFAAS